MISINQILSILFVGVLLWVSTYLFMVDKRMTRCIKENTSLLAKLEQQNEELARYKAARPEIVEKTITKYKTVEVKTGTCEATLNSAKDLLRKFYE